MAIFILKMIFAEETSVAKEALFILKIVAEEARGSKEAISILKLIFVEASVD